MPSSTTIITCKLDPSALYNSHPMPMFSASAGRNVFCVIEFIAEMLNADIFTLALSMAKELWTDMHIFDILCLYICTNKPGKEFSQRDLVLIEKY